MNVFSVSAVSNPLPDIHIALRCSPHRDKKSTSSNCSQLEMKDSIQQNPVNTIIGKNNSFPVFPNMGKPTQANSLSTKLYLFIFNDAVFDCWCVPENGCPLNFLDLLQSSQYKMMELMPLPHLVQPFFPTTMA